DHGVDVAGDLDRGDTVVGRVLEVPDARLLVCRVHGQPAVARALASGPAHWSRLLRMLPGRRREAGAHRRVEPAANVARAPQVRLEQRLGGGRKGVVSDAEVLEGLRLETAAVVAKVLRRKTRIQVNGEHLVGQGRLGVELAG